MAKEGVAADVKVITESYSWMSLRKTNAVDSAPSEKDFSHRSDHCKEAPVGLNKAEIACMMDAGVTECVVLVGVYDLNGPFEPVAVITFTKGTQAVVASPTNGDASSKVYAHALAEVSSWYKIDKADYEGNGGIAKAEFDPKGRPYIVGLVTGITGTGEVEIIYRGY